MAQGDEGDQGRTSDPDRAARAEEVFLEHLGERPLGAGGRGAEGLEVLCRRHPELAGELRLLQSGMEALARVRSRIEASERARDPALRGLVETLARGDFERRFELRETLGGGGQGVVQEALEHALGRAVAVKQLRADLVERAGERYDALLARFLAEAQITAQLDHPGVVAVHELALDGGGRPYFTMTRVRGRDLGAVFEACRALDADWPLVRCLAVLQRVCETMSFAHARGVVHRDLKPANVMVGSYGEVFVMDWGLARAAGGAEEPRTGVHTVRAGGGETSLLSTLPSENLGTVFYMAPEVAARGLAHGGPAADVYAVGAMLYELLSGRPPYWTGASDATHAEVLERVRAAPPEPLSASARDAPPELVSIAARAMAREPARRYADMAALVADLRAFLEDRVVRAHESGPVAELHKWIARNRRLAGALALALCAALGGLAAVAAVAARGRARLDVQADLFRLPYLEVEAERLWPEAPATIPAYEAWLSTADALVARLDVHRAALAELRDRALALDAGELEAFRARSPLAAELAAAELRAADLSARTASAAGAELEGLATERSALAARQSELERELAAARPWRFARAADQLRHDALAETVKRLEAFADPERGLAAGVRARLEFARAVEGRTLVAAAAAWEDAVARVADPGGPYGGLALAPLLGLVPLGPDPASGLEEFALVRSGEPPARSADGALALDGGSALVMVLVPRGRFHLGAQAGDPAVPGFDASARPEEGPVRELELAAFLIAKHELTQGQWFRLGGGRPSEREIDGAGQRDRHPVDGVSWNESAALLARFGLSLPTEAQWEYAARAGRDGPFLGRDEPPGDPRGLAGAVNLADATVIAAGLGWPQANGMQWLDDGHARHAPVASYAPNAFGLHDVLGNVWEWCLDQPGPYDAPVHPESGLRVAEDDGERVARGGGYVNNAAFARVSIRDLGRSADFDSGYHGVRPAMVLPR